ncbi:MAG TPA: hypothetical protein VKS44_14505 [Candidatus Acidoferrales bacterium]|nr:hypothetical protein [Candidatus Acidoferrales bacterium]
MNFSKPFHCKEEMRVIKSARTGFWDADLEQHVATCAVCSEAAATARLLNEMRATDEAECRIPDSGLMWWKAQLLAKREAGERATQPISVVERFAYALGAVCAIGVCAWQWQALRDWLISVGTSGVRQGGVFFSNLAAYSGKILDPPILGYSNFFGGSALLVASSAALLLLFVIFGAYLAQSED